MRPERLQEAQTVRALVAEAFCGVTLGKGIGLRETQGLDDYADAGTCAAYRAADEKQDWRRIPVAALNACYSSLSFFDAEGMRFHLPAFLIADLDGDYHQELSFLLAFLNDYSIGQFALLSPAQRSAVRAYLRFRLGEENRAFSHPHIVRALDEYWIDPS
jgi:hypothetical protein